MEILKLDKMLKGWFVGNFSPTAFTTDSCEVAVKYYKAGVYEPTHIHKVATEITVLISGRVQMCNQLLVAGDIIVLPPNSATDFKVLEDSITVVVKVPGALNDKYASGL